VVSTAVVAKIATTDIAFDKPATISILETAADTAAKMFWRES